jgi:molecular chaperone GrpE
MTERKKKRQEQAEAPDAEANDAAETAGAAEAPPAAETVEALHAERDGLLARLQRLSADYRNYQKRVQKDMEQAREYANEELMRSLLTVLDNMERALDTARENHGEEDPLYKGMQLVHQQALETLGRFGLAAIEARGQAFDPELHAAVLQEPSEEHPPLTILREVQKGYRLKGRTLRPSAVVVAAPPEQAAGPGERTGEADADV